ncbi:hypothetical protein [Natrialbaceae archaeon AArc-T1-2]|nr:hypothetical protein [Natrialbaceae archaeon AArc-T1-2]WIV67231.1 hypothetical protein QQ977_00470 [Natrialbaceae archaeon AArc-T1-2]
MADVFERGEVAHLEDSRIDLGMLADVLQWHTFQADLATAGTTGSPR